jgi:hypothetical protein
VELIALGADAGATTPPHGLGRSAARGGGWVHAIALAVMAGTAGILTAAARREEAGAEERLFSALD